MPSYLNLLMISLGCKIPEVGQEHIVSQEPLLPVRRVEAEGAQRSK